MSGGERAAGGFEGRSEYEPEIAGDWLRQERIYEIPLVDGCDVHELLKHIGVHASGDSAFQQIASGLDRLKELGYEAMYVLGAWAKERDPYEDVKDEGSPFCLVDHEHVDPVWGTDDDFSHLVEAADKKGMAIGVDLVLNHVSWGHPWLAIPGFCLTRDQIRQRGAATQIVNGREEKLWFDDVAQLDLSNPEVREKIIDMVISIVKRLPPGAKFFFRLDMAAQLLNENFSRRWGVPMPEREWLADLIEAVRRINPNIAFLAESHGEATDRELRAIGFNVCPSKADDHHGPNIGYLDAWVSGSVSRVNAALESFVRTQDSTAAMAMIGNHDTPAPKRALGDNWKAAMALSIFLRPMLWLGATETGYDAHYLARDPLEYGKEIPLGVRHDFSQVNDPEMLNLWIRLSLEEKKMFDELGQNVRYDMLPGSGLSDWVGVSIQSRVKHSAPIYHLVVAFSQPPRVELKKIIHREVVEVKSLV